MLFLFFALPSFLPAGTGTRATMGLEVGGGSLVTVGTYDLTGVFTLWSGNDFEANITYSQSTQLLTMSVREVGFTDAITYSWPNTNMAANLGCGPNPPQGGCRTWMGVSKGEAKSRGH